MGGRLNVRSEVGVGSTFSFTLRLPAGMPGVEKLLTEQHQRKSYNGPQLAILVVDDHEANRELLYDRLHAIGFRVKTAHSGSDALEQLRHYQPDLMLVDLMMPGMDGFELMNRVRTSERLHAIHMIALSASAFDEFEVRSLAAGAAYFLAKPLDFQRLLEIIQQEFAHRWQ